MSELLAAVAAALGTPEALVKRAAEARAAATGASVDEVLGAWAGGGSVSAPAPAAATPQPEEEMPPTSVSSPSTTSVDTESSDPQPETDRPSPTGPSPSVPAGPYKPPVLVGAVDNPARVLAGVIGLFLVVLLIGFVGPSIPTENIGARTSYLDLTETARSGQHTYSTLGCAACHTQMVRPVIADVGLGPVTLNDTNQILGLRRFGPDLSDIGSRATPPEMELLVRGTLTHPGHNLSADDMASLIAYLVASDTSEEEG